MEAGKARVVDMEEKEFMYAGRRVPSVYLARFFFFSLRVFSIFLSKWSLCCLSFVSVSGMKPKRLQTETFPPLLCCGVPFRPSISRWKNGVWQNIYVVFFLCRRFESSSRFESQMTKERLWRRQSTVHKKKENFPRSLFFPINWKSIETENSV